MNFLSHLYLSGESEGLLLGNFIADSVKGRMIENFSPEVQAGIILHRKIDTFTDQHIIVEESKKRLRPKYRKYAGVIVDIYYDHFLARNWEHYSSQSLSDYSKSIYTLVERNKVILPLRSSQFADYMIRYNILNAYAELHGIERVLKGMARRASFVSNMEHSIHDLKEHYDLFEIEFREFFPELRQFVNEQIEI
ncbi:MAG: ACP phosphodiesterase [Bacteroidota bacterium]|nr:ACP phosphodiesterase [Bacteroidota bacterium]